MRKFVVSVFLVSCFWGGISHATTCQFEGANTTISQISTSSQHLEMIFPGESIRKNITQVLVSSDQPLDVAQAKLWMPSMGHGSAPTRVVRVSDMCIKIENVKFMMSGDWEIHLKLGGGHSAVFAFDVE